MNSKRTLLLCTLLVITLLATGAYAASGNAGSTLQAAKTIDICANPDGTIWHFSGVVAVWNTGDAQACGLQIVDCIQSKTSGPTFTNNSCQNLDVTGYGTCNTFPTGTGQVPALTEEVNAETFNYSVDLAPLTGTIRNDAKVTIMNHSGPGFKTISGPEPKATYTGSIPPPTCASGAGCTLTQGYWTNHNNTVCDTDPSSPLCVIWPGGHLPTETFFLSGGTWLGVLNTPDGGNAYYGLAHQYIAAVLNQATGASVPLGVQSILDQSKAWFEANAPSACSTHGSCGTQRDWQAILDEYNNGLYPGGPPHCDGDVPPAN